MLRIPLLVAVVKVVCMSLLPLVNSVLISKLQIVWFARVEFVGSLIGCKVSCVHCCTAGCVQGLLNSICQSFSFIFLSAAYGQ